MPRHDNAPVRAALLRSLVSYSAEHGRAPTHKAIGACIGRSRPSAGKHLKDLEASGHVSIVGPRAIVVHDPPIAPLPRPTVDPHTEIVQEAHKRLKALMPNVPAAQRATLAEAVAGAVERGNATT